MAYDEFGLFHENAEEFGIAWRGEPEVARVAVDVGDGQSISALVWGDRCPGARADPRRRAERAHLGHGRARARPPARRDRPPGPRPLVAQAGSRVLARGERRRARQGGAGPRARTRGSSSACRSAGSRAIALADRAPDLVRALAARRRDAGREPREGRARSRSSSTAPSTSRASTRSSSARCAFNPTRSESSLRRGILHNAVEDADGRWRWRYDLPRLGSGEGDDGRLIPGLDTLWDAISQYPGPLTLARGALSPVVDDADVAELMRRRPDAQSRCSRAPATASRATSPSSSPRILPQCSTGNPAARHAWKPPIMSVARVSPRSCRRAAARLET